MQVLKAVEVFNQKDATAKVEENAEDAEKQEAGGGKQGVAED